MEKITLTRYGFQRLTAATVARRAPRPHAMRLSGSGRCMTCGVHHDDHAQDAE